MAGHPFQTSVLGDELRAVVADDPRGDARMYFERTSQNDLDILFAHCLANLPPIGFFVI